MIRQTLAYFLARGGPAIVNFAAIAAYTRLLEPEEYGIYALTVSGAALLNTVFFYWIRAGMSRFFHPHADMPQRLFSTLARSFLKMMLVTFGVAGLVNVFELAEYRFVALGLLLVWAFAAFELSLEIARSRFNARAYGLLGMLRSALTVLLGVGLIYSGLGGEAPLIGMILGMSVVVAVTGFGERAHVRWSSSDPELGREIFRYAGPLTAIAALGFVVSTSDRFILAYLMSRQAVGHYSAGYELAQYSLGTLFMVVNLAAYPRVVRALDLEGVDAAREQLTKNLGVLLLVGLPGLVGLVICAPNIAHVMLGQEFSPSASIIIPWLALAAFVGGLKTNYTDLSFHLSKSTTTHLLITALSAATNVILNFLWIPTQGIAGAAYATLASLAVGLALSALLGRRTFVLPGPDKSVWKVCLSTAVMGISVWAFRGQLGAAWLGVQVAGGTLIFCTMGVLLNMMGVRDELQKRIYG